MSKEDQSAVERMCGITEEQFAIAEVRRGTRAMLAPEVWQA